MTGGVPFVKVWKTSSALEFYLGLRGAEKADRIVIYWTDRSVSEAENVPAGQVLELRREP